MRSAALLCLAWCLGGCAVAPPMPAPAPLFRDGWFAASSVPVRAADALAVSAEMRRYLSSHLLTGTRHDDRKQHLLDALYAKGELQLEYDASMTRTASEAFAARSGNCLALVMMTGAFAREMGLEVRYQMVLGDDAWERASGLLISVGHVNLTLDEPQPRVEIGYMHGNGLTVDFVPLRDGRAPRVRVIPERTVVAMYLNNRAVESLSRGLVDDAYWWVRESLRTDPELLSGYITLAVIYRDRHQPALAEAVLARVREREPDNVAALSNLALVLRDQGRGAEAAALTERLDALNPHPPFSYFQLGMTALKEHRFEAARDLLAREVDRAPYYHEFQFWLAVAYLELHDTPHALEHLAKAKDVSTTRRDHDLYAVKLDKLKALGVR